jgi:integrase/recombinase XerD
VAVYETAKKGKRGQRVWRIVQWSGGKAHETSHTGTRKAANAVDRELAAKLERGDVAKSAPQGEGADLLTFSRGDYATHAKAHLAPTTWSVRRFQLANVCRHLGSLKLTEIDTRAGERFQAARLTEGAEPSTVNTEWAKLQAVLAYARSIGVPCGSPSLKALPVRGRGRVKFWTLDQLQRLFAAVEAESPALLPVVVFLANTGCRKGEALACERSWVNLQRDMLEIPVNDDWQPKNGEPREVPIALALRPWLVKALQNGGRYVFPARTGERWACWPKLQFGRAVRAAGLSDDGEGPHKLRHTFASHFLANGGDLFLLSKLLGHADVKTTTRIYAHLLPSHLEKARGVVNLSPATGPAKLEARRRWAR